MASLHPSWFSSLHFISPAKPTLSSSTTLGMASTYKPIRMSRALNPDSTESSEPTSPNSPETTPKPQTGPADPAKLAFSKAKAYKESLKSNSSSVVEQSAADDSVKQENANDGAGLGQNIVDGGQRDLSVSVKIAMEKAKKYKQNKGVAVSDKSTVASETTQGLRRGDEGTSGNNVIDNTVGKKGELSISRIDFVGLEFADKKTTKGLPPGLVPISDPFFNNDVPEVELIVGDTSKFDAEKAPKPEQTKEDESELYKPKVSTWGVFPRPSNISKTFGGGRVIRPGEVLETEEEKAVKEARTKQLIAAYKKKIGLNIDAKLKSECEKALADGDLLMNAGKLKEALPYYEKVMDKLTFQSELHGLAALQWSICQDSLSRYLQKPHDISKLSKESTRSNEARIMYEKLQSHPNAKVSKKARQFIFSFQAMEMMKVTTGSPFYLRNTGYQNYFDAFIENKSNYPLEDDVVQESAVNQLLGPVPSIWKGRVICSLSGEAMAKAILDIPNKFWDR